MRKTSFGQNNNSFLDRIIEKLRSREVLPHIKNNSNLLDLGCGYYANFLVSLSPIISKGTGIDFSITKKNIPNNIILKKSNIDNKLPFAANYFDIILALALIEHVDNPLKLLKEGHRVLKTKGSILITTPSKISKPLLNLLAKYNLISREEILDHKRYYNPAQLSNQLIKAGFKKDNIKVKYFEMGANILAKATK